MYIIIIITTVASTYICFQCTVHRSRKAMAPHSSTLAWKVLWMKEPGRLQSMGSLRVGYDWATSLSLFTFMHWRRKGQPTPVFFPGESQRWGSLVGCRLWGRTRVGHDWSDLATTRKCPMRKKMFVWISKTPYLYKSIYCLELHRQSYFDDAV